MTSSPTPTCDAPDPLWIHALLAAVLPTFVYFAVGNQLDGDAYHYVEYWRKLWGGIRHETSLHEVAPKPIPILLFGSVYGTVPYFGALVAVTLAAGAFAVALLARSVHIVAGRLASKFALVFLSVLPLSVRGMVEGSSAVLELFFLSAALLVHLRAGRQAAVAAGLLLLAAGLCRPDAWPVFLLLLLLGAAGSRAGVARRQIWTTAGIALIAPALWLAFDAVLAGDALHSFRDTLDYGRRHDGTEVRKNIIGSALAYARQVATGLVEASPGPGLLMGGAGWLLLLRTRWHLAVCLVGSAVAMIGFYYVPFRSGLELMPRFLLVPACLSSALAGIAVASLVEGVRRVQVDRASGWGLPSRWTAGVLAILASLHSASAVRRWATGMGAFHARMTRSVTEGLDWLVAEFPDARTSTFAVPARRKGLAVLQLDVKSDRVTSLERLDTIRRIPELSEVDGFSGLADVDYFLFLPEDMDDGGSAWDRAVFPPTGFQEIPVPDSSPLRCYRRIR